MQHTVTPESIAHGRRVGEWLLTIALMVYYSPTVYAACSGKRWGGLFLFNTLFAWSGAGWFACWWRATRD